MRLSEGVFRKVHRFTARLTPAMISGEQNHVQTVSRGLGLTTRLQAFFAVILTPLFATAVPSLSTSLAPLQPSVRSPDQLSVSIMGQSFVDRAAAPLENRESTRLSARLRTRNDSRPISGVLEVGGSFDTTVEKQISFEVPEAYLTWAPDHSVDKPAPVENGPHGSVVTIHAGRKREAWSDLDSYWTLGIWQPLNKFDGLRPSEQGLTGVFGQFSWERAELLLFGSAIYIPEQGPAYELQEGRFTTNNAWFSSPAEDVVLVSRGTPLRYRLETPPVGSVISHYSGGFLFRAGQLTGQGFHLQAGFAKKPRNQLSLPFSGVLMTDALNPQASVTIHPQVAYHNVASLELGHRDRYWTLGLSALADISDPEDIAPSLVWQRYHPLYMVSPTLEFRIAQTEHYTPWLRLSYLHPFGGEQEMIGGGSVKPEQNPFGSRTMYRQAASLELRGRLFRLGPLLRGWTIEHGFRWIEEFTEQGAVLMADLRLASRESWQIGIYADFLASQQPESKNPGFISRFRGNDRVGAQFTYVF